jgi:hypothetical protein
MANTTSQVQHDQSAIEAELAELRAELERRKGPFGEGQANGRHYPGEGAGRYLAKRLNRLPESSAERSVIMVALWTLRQYEQGERSGDVLLCERLLKRRGFGSPKFWFRHLYATAAGGFEKRSKVVIHGIHENGVVIQPSTPEERDAFAILSLRTKGRIERIRRCRYCRFWFYARFHHQLFCGDPAKRCQWKHYHSPEWRRKNRERNKEHQRAYRKRLFERPKPKLSRRNPAD